MALYHSSFLSAETLPHSIMAPALINELVQGFLFSEGGSDAVAVAEPNLAPKHELMSTCMFAPALCGSHGSNTEAKALPFPMQAGDQSLNPRRYPIMIM
eukprot:1161514-Pelagomonas_calceolata.AAC.1